MKGLTQYVPKKASQHAPCTPPFGPTRETGVFAQFPPPESCVEIGGDGGVGCVGGVGGGVGGVGGGVGGRGGVNMQIHCLPEEHAPELPPPNT